MDPNEALRQIREALAVVTSDQPEDSEYACAVDNLADGVEALDGWLSRGGFLPAAWMRHEDSDQERELPARSGQCALYAGHVLGGMSEAQHGPAVTVDRCEHPADHPPLALGERFAGPTSGLDAL